MASTQEYQLLDITSTTAELYLQVDDLYPNPVRIIQFSTDQSFALEQQTIAEYRFGVDGGLAVGYRPTEKKVTVSLEASSPSWQVMENILRSDIATKKKHEVTMTAVIPSVNRRFVFSCGFLNSGTAMPNPKTVLEPTQWEFVFAKMETSEIS